MRVVAKTVAGFAAGALAALSAMAQEPADNSNFVRVVAGYSEIVFDRRDGTPASWTLCQSLCTYDDPRRQLLFEPDDGGFARLAPFGSVELLQFGQSESEAAVTVRFANSSKVYEYRISKTLPLVEIDLPDDELLRIRTGSSFVPTPLPGFGAIYSRVTLAQVDEDGQLSVPYEDGQEERLNLIANTGNWTGIRNRYWAWLVQPVDATVEFEGAYTQDNRPRLSLLADKDDQQLTLRIYAGPIEWRSMRAVSPVLTETLFAALWDFLRWLTLGMTLLLEFLYGIVGNWGIAIILLSLTAKILMSPLTMLADRWQRDVNRIQSLLKPELDEIRRSYKGEEAHERTLALYKKHNVSMFYTFKSAAGFLIQIPVFIAAFDMLAENVALNQISFLWISDLAKPDALTELPFVLPFFGGWLNLLPFLMTGLSVLAARLQKEESLSPELQRQQSVRLYLMSAAFFILFYTFPAGMVLYWTSSNLFHLIKVEVGRLFRRD
jgi:YidC/Oxa1 family membrane protein insertase